MNKLNSVCSDPETFAPLAAGGDGLQIRVLSVVRQVGRAGHARHRLEADERLRLAVLIRLPHDCDGILRSEKRLDALVTGLDVEERATVFLALQVDEAVIQCAPA